MPTYSVILPVEETPQFYESFTLQYSLIITSNLLINELIENSTEESVLESLTQYHGIIHDYKEKQIHLASLMLEYTPPQTEEIRGLALDKLFMSMGLENKTPKFILQSIQNTKELLLLHSVFEGVIKTEAQRVHIIPEGKYFREKDIPEVVKNMVRDKEEYFLEILSSRCPLKTFADINDCWVFFTHLRHAHIHSGGYATPKWIDQFKTKKENLLTSISNWGSSISSIQIYKIIEDLEAQPGKLLYTDNQLSNIFRNFIVNIMESLYLTKK